MKQSPRAIFVIQLLALLLSQSRADDHQEKDDDEIEVSDTWKKIAWISSLILVFLLIVCFASWYYCIHTSGQYKAKLTKKDFVKQ